LIANYLLVSPGKLTEGLGIFPVRSPPADMQRLANDKGSGNHQGSGYCINQLFPSETPISLREQAAFVMGSIFMFVCQKQPFCFLALI